MVTGLSNTALNHIRPVPQSCHGQSQLPAEFPDIGAAHVAQLYSLQVVPDALVWVKIRRISRQPFQTNPLSAPIGEKRLDWLPAMDRRAIPDHQQQPRDVPQQMLEKANDILGTVGTLLRHQQQGAIHGDSTDGRYVIPAEAHAQNGGLSSGSISTHQGGQQIEARFVYPDDRSTFFFSPFFSAGQRSVYHSLMAASSRWVARRIGFWTLQPMDLRSRQI